MENGQPRPQEQEERLTCGDPSWGPGLLRYVMMNYGGKQQPAGLNMGWDSLASILQWNIICSYICIHAGALPDWAIRLQPSETQRPYMVIISTLDYIAIVNKLD